MKVKYKFQKSDIALNITSYILNVLIEYLQELVLLRHQQ